MLEKQPKFLSVGKISFRVHVGITTVLEKQPKVFECLKNIIPSSCRNYHGVGKATKILNIIPSSCRNYHGVGKATKIFECWKNIIPSSCIGIF